MGRMLGKDRKWQIGWERCGERKGLWVGNDMKGVGKGRVKCGWWMGKGWTRGGQGVGNGRVRGSQGVGKGVGMRREKIRWLVRSTCC